jgi:DUF971 family protein
MEPRSIDLKRDESLTIVWSDGLVSTYPIAYLRRMSPSADAREMRREMERNPLTVIKGGGSGAISATNAELVGNYALRITFSDGHASGLFTWTYLRSLDPAKG